MNRQKCENCIYCGATKDGRDACVQFQKLLYDKSLSCPWWISADDPECCNCHRPTIGKGIYYKGKIYCAQCAAQLID